MTRFQGDERLIAKAGVEEPRERADRLLQSEHVCGWLLSCRVVHLLVDDAATERERIRRRQGIWSAHSGDTTAAFRIAASPP